MVKRKRDAETVQQRQEKLAKDRQRKAARRQEESSIEKKKRQEIDLLHKRKTLASECLEQKENRLHSARISQQKRLINETEEQRSNRLKALRIKQQQRHLNETKDQRSNRLAIQRTIMKQQRTLSESQENRDRRRQADLIAHNERLQNETDVQKHERLVKNFNKQINAFADFPCMVCKKLLYSCQIVRLVENNLSSHALNYLPTELKHIMLKLCNRCKSHLSNNLKESHPSRAYWNALDPGLIPDEISLLSSIERRLISRINLYLKIIKLDGRFGQKALKGQAIHFAQDVQEIPEQLLPRPIDECGLVIVTEVLENVNTIRQLHINFSRLENGLRWLIANNPLYNDVRIQIPDEINIQSICRVPLNFALSDVESEWRVKGNQTRVLRANFHQTKQIFGIHAGQQCTAMTAAALVKFKLLPINDWTSTTIDQILLEGNNLYIEIVHEYPRHLYVNELPRDTEIFNRRVHFLYLNDPAFFGTVDGNSNALSLETAILTFFGEYDFGILICNSYSRLIAKLVTNNVTKYYLFDSHSCGPGGTSTHTNFETGKACVIEAESLTVLVRLLKLSIGGRNKNKQFTIDTINIEIIRGTSYDSNAIVISNPNDHAPQHVMPSQPSYIPINHSIMLHADHNHPSVLDIVEIPNQQNEINLNQIKRKTDSIVNICYELKSEELAWFHLFPYGINGFQEQREVNITPLDYFQTRIMGSDTRFQTPEYLMYSLAMYEYCRTKSNINVCGKKVRQNGQVVEDLHLYVKNLRGSGAYFSDCGKEIIAMIKQLGAPTFFLTFSPNDLKWHDLRKALLLADGRSNILPEKLSMDYTQNMIEKYPVVVMRHFENRVQALMKVILGDSTLFGGMVNDFWWRIEFQNRGSPHLHMVIWVENFPSLSSPDTLALLDSIISCRLPDSNEDVNFHTLVKDCQTHRHTHSCYKKTEYCRFGFPRRLADNTKIIDSESSELINNAGRICLLKRRRSEEWINNYHPVLLRLWNGNMDIQPCGQTLAIAYYIAKYVSKGEPLALDKTLRDAILSIRREQTDPLRKIFKICMEMLNRRQVSSCECALRLCHLKFKQSSRKSIFLNTRIPEKRYKVIQFSNNNEHDNEYCQTIFDRYQNRPNELEEMTLFEFAMWYEPVYARNIQTDDHDEGDDDVYENNNDEQQARSNIIILKGQRRSRMRKRNKAAIVKTPKFSARTDLNSYLYHQLVCHIPFRQESSLLSNYESVRSAFEARKVELEARLESLRPLQNFSDELDAALEHMQTIGDENINEIDEDLISELPENNHPVQMPDEIYNRNVQQLNIQQQTLIDYIKRQISCDIKNENPVPLLLFITGSAGTGKTFTLKLITEQIQRSYKIVDTNGIFVKIAAPTGVAALLVNGLTLHSLLKLPIQKTQKMPDYHKLTGIFLETLRRQWANVRFMIIDEVSMIPYEMLVHINYRLQEIKNNVLLFGGLNVLLFGDLMQLPPVIGSPIFQQPKELEGSVHLFQQFSFCELTEIVRQREDREFVDLLNNLREGRLTVEQYRLLVTKQSTYRKENESIHERCLRILPTNSLVQKFNESVINSIDPAIKKYVVIAQDRLVENDARSLKRPLQDIVPQHINKTGGVPKEITLYIGLRVMLRRNYDISNGLVNGSMGKIINIIWPGMRRGQIYAQDIPSVEIEFDNNIGKHLIRPIELCFDSKFGYGPIERHMLPFVPCYAVTVHKLQGCTIQSAVVNLGPKYFAPGQKFVALSRCSSLNSIEIDEIAPNGLIEGQICNEDALVEMERLRKLPRYNAAVNLGPKYFAPGQKFVALSRCSSLNSIEIDEIAPNGLIEGQICNEDALVEIERLRKLPRYNGKLITSVS